LRGVVDIEVVETRPVVETGKEVDPMVQYPVMEEIPFECIESIS
jgi:hypothetical protein